MRVKLNDVADRITGNVDRFNTDLEYYVGGEHYDSGCIAIYNKGILRSEKGSILGFKFHFPFQAGDTLFMARNPHLKKAGMVTYDGITSDASYVLRTKDESVLLPEFLPLVIQNELFWEFFEANKSGSVNYLMNWKEMKNYEFELPSIEEQQRIADLVWATEDCRRRYIELQEYTVALLRAKFVEFFGDLSKNPKGYPVRKLSDISNYWNGLTYKPSDVVKGEEGVLVLRSSNIQNGKLSFEDNVYVNCAIKDKLFVQENDILMCSRNGSAELVGKTALIKGLEKPTTFGAFMMIIRSEYHAYLKTYFELPYFRKQISTGTSTINQITGKMLNEIELPIPDMDTVKRFGEIAKQCTDAISELSQLIESIDSLRLSILNEQVR